LEPIEELEPLSALYQGIQAQAIDAVTRKPITQFTVSYCLAPGEEGGGDITVSTQRKSRPFRNNRNGIMRLYGLEKGVYSLAIEAMGYPTFYKTGLKVPQEEPLLVFEIPRGNFIEGKVLNTMGKPVKGISVHLVVEELTYPHDAPPARRISRSNGEGLFLFGDLPSGRYSLVLNTLHHPMAEVREIYIAPGGSSYQNLTLPDLATVEFHITDMVARPVPHARIHFHEKTGKVTHQLKTDMYGKARCIHIPSGEYSIRIYKNTYKTIHEGNFKILPGSDIIRVERMLIKE
jgi:hypothetical protein